MNWIDLNETIPDHQYDVEVKDEFGNLGIAAPCYYDFKLKQGKLITVPDYHDGSWIIQCDGLENPIKGNLTHWREL